MAVAPHSGCAQEAARGSSAGTLSVVGLWERTNRMGTTGPAGPRPTSRTQQQRQYETRSPTQENKEARLETTKKQNPSLSLCFIEHSQFFHNLFCVLATAAAAAANTALSLCQGGGALASLTFKADILPVSLQRTRYTLASLPCPINATDASWRSLHHRFGLPYSHRLGLPPGLLLQTSLGPPFPPPAGAATASPSELAIASSLLL